MMIELHNNIDSLTTEHSEASGWIQWNGTNVHIDVHCKCGHQGHYDGDFLYSYDDPAHFYECPKCRMKYAIGKNIKLVPLMGDQVKYVDTSIAVPSFAK